MASNMKQLPQLVILSSDSSFFFSAQSDLLWLPHQSFCNPPKSAAFFMFTNKISVNQSVVEGFDDLVAYHFVNTSLGACCTVINCFLLFVFFSQPSFRSKYVLLIQLCCADLINSIAIVATGLNRIELYSTAYSTLTLPVRTSFQCAIEPWLLLKLVGDMLIPVTTLWMGIERFTAITFPIFYHFSVDGKRIKTVFIPFVSCLFVCISISLGVIFAYSDDHETAFFCGRKAAFGCHFGSFIYINNVVCNICATILNAAAYIKARNMALSQPRMQRQVGVIRYYLLISLLSTLLVSLPNTIALFKAYVKTVSDSLSKPSYWAQTINSGLPFFVYFALNAEFRNKVIQLVKCRRLEKDTPLSPAAMDAVETPLAEKKPPIIV